MKERKLDQEQEKLELTRIFDQVATNYDSIGPQFFSIYGRRLVEVTGVRQGARVLDVGVGRGAVLFPAVEVVGESGEVIGVDLSTEMVKLTAQEIRRRNVHNAAVQTMDAENLLFSNASFDYVLCGFTVTLLPDFRLALTEFHRVLKPGGRVGVSRWVGILDERWKWIIDLLQEYSIPPRGSASAGPSAVKKQELDVAARLEAVIREVGFFSVYSTIETFEAVYKDEEEWWAVQGSHGGRRQIEAIEQLHGREGLQRFKEEAFQKIKSFRQQNGIPELQRVLYVVGNKE